MVFNRVEYFNQKSDAMLNISFGFMKIEFKDYQERHQPIQWKYLIIDNILELSGQIFNATI